MIRNDGYKNLIQITTCFSLELYNTEYHSILCKHKKFLYAKTANFHKFQLIDAKVHTFVKD